MKKSSGAKFSIAAVMGVIALVAGVGYYIIHRSQAVGADISGDGVVGIADLSILATNYGKTAQTYASGDITGDGNVGIADLSMLATAWGTTAPTCTGVAMTQGQADIDAHPAGTTYCISGTHNWTLQPKTGDKLVSNPANPGILDGQNITQYAILTYSPSWQDVHNVEIKDLEIRNYTVSSQRGAIVIFNNVPTGWILRNVRSHDNGTVGATGVAGGYGANIGPGWQVLGGRYYNNRQGGLGGGGASGAIVDGVELDHNNFTTNNYTAFNIDCAWECGGMKYAVTTSITLRNNNVHDNAGPGLWGDIDTNNSLITNNQVYNNWGEGIYNEISLGATITNNNVYNNGFVNGVPIGGCVGFGWGAGIMISASENVVVSGNTLSENCNGIIGIQQNRGSYLLRNLNIHHNTVHGGPGVAAKKSDGSNGASGTFTDVAGSNLTDRNIIFSNNTYTGGMRCAYWNTNPLVLCN